MTARLMPNTWTVSGRLIACDIDALWAALQEIADTSETLFPGKLNAVWWNVTTRDHSSDKSDEITALGPIKELVPKSEGSIQFALQHLESTENLGIPLLPKFYLDITIDRFRNKISVSIATVGAENFRRIWSMLADTFSIISMELPDHHKYLDTFIEKFLLDHPDYEKNVFLVMRFRDEAPFPDIVKSIRVACEEAGLHLLRADDCEYTSDLWDNVMTYMYGCSSAIAVFDQINYREFNPNVALEVGFMLSSGKPTLLLKDKAIEAMPSDIIGKIYRPFNTYDAAGTIAPQVKKWISDYRL